MHTDLSTGWQTLFADLSIILFMVTASAVKEAPAKPYLPPIEANFKEDAVPIAVWRDGAGAGSLRMWMAQQGKDPRVSFSMIIRYQEQQLQQSAVYALALAQHERANVRIVLERASENDMLVVASFEHGTAEEADQRQGL